MCYLDTPTLRKESFEVTSHVIVCLSEFEATNPICVNFLIWGYIFIVRVYLILNFFWGYSRLWRIDYVVNIIVARI